MFVENIQHPKNKAPLLGSRQFFRLHGQINKSKNNLIIDMVLLLLFAHVIFWMIKLSKITVVSY